MLFCVISTLSLYVTLHVHIIIIINDKKILNTRQYGLMNGCRIFAPDEPKTFSQGVKICLSHIHRV